MKGFLLLLLGALLITVCFAAPPLEKEEIVDIRGDLLPNFGPAPELTNDTWLNVDAPLRLADLRGQVVLLEMWTFG